MVLTSITWLALTVPTTGPFRHNEGTASADGRVQVRLSSSKNTLDVVARLLHLHICVDFHTFVKEEYPHVVLCYVEAGTTGYCQPLDLATMRVFKLKLRRVTSRQLALRNCFRQRSLT